MEAPLKPGILQNKTEPGRRTRMARINSVFNALVSWGLDKDEFFSCGPDIVKIRLTALSRLENKPRGKLILVTAMTPTYTGEGKTTIAIGLADALNLLRKKAAVALREPSLALAFGLKGAGVGGGKASLTPPQEISLQFTGDFYSVEAAHNLLAAAVDEHSYSDFPPLLDKILWQRVTCVNDRTLRKVMIAMGNSRNGTARTERFLPVACSELMGILCMSRSYDELKKRLAAIVVGSAQGRPVTTSDINFSGPPAAVLSGALQPNLVRTLGNTPAFVHCGPYANTSLGFSSLIATETALRLFDYVVTEAGGASDTGGEKFFNIKSRFLGLGPCVAVVVATVKALMRQGGAERDSGNLRAIEYGARNLFRHIEIVSSFGARPVVAVNRFAEDRNEEIDTILRLCRERNIPVSVSDAYFEGGIGAASLAETVLDNLNPSPAPPAFTYPVDMPLLEKIRLICKQVYGIRDVGIKAAAAEKLAGLEAWGFGELLVCMAKSHTVAPEKVDEVSDVYLASGAGYITALLGDHTFLPALPKGFNSGKVGLDQTGRVTGLF